MNIIIEPTLQFIHSTAQLNKQIKLISYGAAFLGKWETEDITFSTHH